MDHLLAKVSDRTEKYRKLLSGIKVYSKIEGLDKALKYDVAYRLEEDEWYVIEKFSSQKFDNELLVEKMDSTDYKMVNKVEPEKIDYICAYQDEDEFYFQKISKSRMLQNKKFLDIGDDIKMKTAEHALVINDFPDALYRRSEDKLYFKSLEKISSIFRGIEILYRKATQQEVDDFLDNGFVKVGENYGAQKVGKANRHRLAMAMDTLKKLSKKEQKQIFTYTDEYYPNLHYDGKAFEINNEEELKNLLFGIEQRFYTTPVTKEKRVANSVRCIE